MNELLNHLQNSKKVLKILKNEFKLISDIKLAFVIGSFNKSYFSIVSDLDIIILLDKEELNTLQYLNKLRKRLVKNYSIEIDFMINNVFELKTKVPLCELNDYVINNLNNNKYVVLKKDISNVLFEKDKFESIILDTRYFFNKLRFIFCGNSFFIRGKFKKVVGSEKTKIAISALFNILRRYILVKYNKYVDDYYKINNIIKKESLEEYQLLTKLYTIKKSNYNLDYKDFEKLYTYSRKLYKTITKKVLAKYG